MIASFDVIDFRSPAAAVRYAREARQPPGAVYSRRFASFASHRRAGFVPGIPDPRRVGRFAVWREATARTRGFDPADARGWLSVDLEPLGARGSIHGERPLPERHGRANPPGPLAALTIGRCTARTLPAFTRETPALAASLYRSSGLITAVSLGLPLIANATFSIWASEDDMLRYAYAHDPGAHRATVGRDRERGILAEQLTARFAPVRVDGTWGVAL